MFYKQAFILIQRYPFPFLFDKSGKMSRYARKLITHAKIFLPSREIVKLKQCAFRNGRDPLSRNSRDKDAYFQYAISIGKRRGDISGSRFFFHADRS